MNYDTIMRYQRTILNEIIRSIDEYPVTLITGARQVGKDIPTFQHGLKTQKVSNLTFLGG